MALNNPAARLHNILFLCKQHQKALGGQPMSKAWRNVLSLSDEVEDTIVMSKVGRIYVLPSHVSAEIRRFSDLDHALFLGWKKDPSLAFQRISFNNHFNEFVGNLSDSLLMGIQFCSHELAKRCPEKIVEESSINQLKESVYDVYQEVLSADLPPDLSRYLLDHLYMILDAIDNYLITGARDLQRSIDAAVGTIITKHTMAQTASECDLGKKFWGVIQRAAILLDVAQKAYQLGDSVAKFLPGK